MGGLGTTCGGNQSAILERFWYQVFQSGHQGLGGCLGGFATINHFEEAIYVKNYAWWILTWRFYSALAGTPKKSVKVRGLDHPNMTGDFRKSGGYWIHKSTKSLDSKFLSGTPERGSGTPKQVMLFCWQMTSGPQNLETNVTQLCMIICEKLRWSSKIQLFDSEPSTCHDKTHTNFPQKQHILSNTAYYHVFQICVGLKNIGHLVSHWKKRLVIFPHPKGLDGVANDLSKAIPPASRWYIMVDVFSDLSIWEALWKVR